MLIATAGHIDHGKTSLIRALTGVETDRLPEERSRGISIDLGFAYWRPDAGATIGFVDVPGHERFVRTMIAGFSGIDFALLVVAADDGVMPQTVEHLHILHMLGIRRAIVALTKVDRASADQRAKTRRAIFDLLADTPLADTQILEVNPLEGTGMPQLAAALMAARGPVPDDTGFGFRMAIDRAFTVAGAGSVVTGTVLSGRVQAGDSLILSPLGREVRVRGLQSAGCSLDTIGRGERGAFNLAGVELADIHRGDWLVETMGHAPTQRIEVLVALAPGQDRPLRHDSQVHFHHASAAISARILTLRQRAIAHGEPVLAQIVLDRPHCAVTDDRFVLRDQSGTLMLGGGHVLDPLLPARRRLTALRQLRAQALALADPAARLMALAAIPGEEPELAWFTASANLTASGIEAVLARSSVVRTGKAAQLLIAGERFTRMEAAIAELIRQYHAEHPSAGGMTRRAARAAMPEPVSADLFDSLLRRLETAGRIELDGALLRLPGFTASFSPAETEFWRQVLAVLEGKPVGVINQSELAKELRVSEVAVGTLLLRRKVSGDLWQVTSTKFMLRQHVMQLVAHAAVLAEACPQGFTAAQFRDASGIGRNFVIQLLEFFDRIGVTRRNGEARRMRGDWRFVVGEARPPSG